MRLHLVFLLVMVFIGSLLVPPPVHAAVSVSVDGAREWSLAPAPAPSPVPASQSCGTVPANGQMALRRLAEMFPALLRSQDDDERRAWIRKAAEQMAFTVEPSWGTKNAGGGRPPSKDALARIVGGTLCGWDIVNGNTRELTFGEGAPLPGQAFIVVSPVNHIGGTITPTPPPADAITRAELDAALATLALDLRLEIGGLLSHIGDRVLALEARPPIDLQALNAAIEAALANYEAAGTTGRTLAHTHSVTLRITRRK